MDINASRLATAWDSPTFLLIVCPVLITMKTPLAEKADALDPLWRVLRWRSTPADMGGDHGYY
eukprot:COSAG01_NODE_4632_length_4861_cov_2.222596_3_plen_63_part_00